MTVAPFFILDNYGTKVKTSEKQKADERGKASFEAASKSYLANETLRLAKSYYMTKVIHLRRFEEFLGSRANEPISGVQLPDVQAYVMRRRETVKPATVNKGIVLCISWQAVSRSGLKGPGHRLERLAPPAE